MNPNVSFYYRMSRHAWEDEAKRLHSVSEPLRIEKIGRPLDPFEKLEWLPFNPPPFPKKTSITRTVHEQIQESLFDAHAPYLKEEFIFHPFTIFGASAAFKRNLGHHKILVAIDAWTLQEDFLNNMKALKKILNADLILVHIGPKSETQDIEVKLQNSLDAFFKNEPFLSIEHSRPAQAISDLAQKEACSLIFMSTHGREGKERVLEGSVAEEVMKHARVPVLIHKTGNHLNQIRKILIPFDSLENLYPILPSALSLSKILHAEIWLFHASSKPLQFVFEKTQNWMNQLQDFTHHYKSHEFKSETDAVADTIIHLVENQQIDLVMMRTHSDLNRESLLLDGVTVQVLRKIQSMMWTVEI